MPSVLHELPGRVRFWLPSLGRERYVAVALERQLASLPGVRAVSASCVTGAVLLTHDGRPGTRDRIVNALERFEQSFVHNAKSIRVPVFHAQNQNSDLNPLVRLVLEHILERALGAFVAAVI